ncbi:MAG: CoA-binding protein [Pikeienuella sp.]
MSNTELPVNDPLCALFRRTRAIAVVGLSPKEDRPSFDVARYLQGAGFRIYPINPQHAGSIILGEPVLPSLDALAQRGAEVEIVNIFRRPEAAGAVVDEAIMALAGQGLACVWMQLGVIDRAAAARAEAAGLLAVMDRCTKIEHARLLASGCPDLSHPV